MEPTILDHTQVGILFADKQDIIRYANPIACRLLGTDLDRLLEREVTCAYPECLRVVIADAIRTFRNDVQAPPITAHSSLCANGLLLRCAPVADEDNRYGGLVVNLIDITDNVRMLERRFEDQKIEAIRALTAGIAHGFNNLMATVLGLASYMKSRRSENHPDRANLMQIEDAAATAGRLAHQLLAFVRGGKFIPRIASAADLMALVKSQVETLVPREVQLDYRVAAHIWQVDCDPVEIGQVILTLCRNAIEAMPQSGRLTIQAENTVVTAPPANTRPVLAPGEYVCISVEDTGCGMDSATINRLFEPFFTTKPGGYGLSLAAAYSVMRSHGGAIAVTSERGKGSSFGIWLPRTTAT